MGGRRRSVRVVGVLAVVALAVAACIGDRPSPDVIPPATPGAATTLRPTPRDAAASSDASASLTSSSAPATPNDDPVSLAPSGDPRLQYAELLLRLADARPVAADLNATLVAAAEAQDPDAVRRAAVDILAFTDDERSWLRSHPPATCYADTHASAGRMVAAYAATAEDAIDWADAGGGLAALEALAAVLDSATVARDALEDLAADLESTRCLA